MKNKSDPKGSWSESSGGSLGFALVEVLLVVAVISVLAAGGYVVATGLQESSRVSKLESDVAVINSAIQVHKSRNGTFPAGATPQQAVDELKKATASADAAATIGLKGTLVDPRLAAVMQTAAEAGSGRSRALWDGTAGRFVIATSGAGGVQRFAFDNAMGEVNYGTTARTPGLAGSTDGEGWVWNYTDGTAPGGTTGPTGPGTGTEPTGTLPTAPEKTQLQAPVAEPPGGDYPLFDFPMAVTLMNPNPPGTSQLHRRDTDALYSGAAIMVASGGTVPAHYAKTSDPDNWEDSMDSAAEVYNAIPFQLVVAVNLPFSQMTYQEAGGAMDDGAPVLTPAPAVVTVTNAGEIPVAYQSSANFEVVWTYDGSDPLLAGNPATVVGPGFSGSVPTFEVETGLDRWVNGTLTVRAAARAKSAEFLSSAVESDSATVEKMVLERPYIDPPSTALSADLPVSIYPELVPYPVGARAYYTLNGTEPGASADGQPTSGTLYTTSFTTGTTDGSAVVRARYYGPSDYAEWFTPSPVHSAVYTSGAGGTGAVVADATINGTYIGSLIITSTKNFNFNSGASIRAGNLFVRGTPSIVMNGGVIEGRQFLSDGTEVIPATDTRTIVDLDGPTIPSNYAVRLNSGSIIEGKIYRRVNIFSPPLVAEPPGPSNSNNLNVGAPRVTPIDPTVTANVNLNSGAGDVSLLPGNYGSMNTGSGTSFVLGVEGATTPSVYNFQSLNLNGGSQIKVIGPVILTLDNGPNINSSIMGNPDHPEWLSLRIHSGNMSINSGSEGYADLNAPSSNVQLNGIFRGSVIAQTLTINGNGVAITQATVTDEGE